MTCWLRNARLYSSLAAALALTTGAVAAAAPAASADETSNGDHAPQVRQYRAVGGESKPDDITRLGDSVYVSFQNGVGPLGEPSSSGVTSSTIQEYRLDGEPGRSWSVPGKVDGLTADPARHRLLLTANEDGNSSFSTLSPQAEQPLRTFTYTGLTHGGGTDAIAIVQGRILVSASAPSDTTGPAAYQVTLRGTTARLAPVFSDRATATIANGPQAGHTVTLALTDPDSNTAVPSASPRFAGTFMLDGQADKQLIFAARPRSATPRLQMLTVPQPLDDTVFAAEPEQTLWVTDPTHNVVYRVTGAVKPGDAVSSVAPDTGPSYLARLNLTTGALTPITQLASIAPKGLTLTTPGEDQ